MLNIVKDLETLCEKFILQVDSIGNECAWTDCTIEEILATAEKLRKEYDKI